MRERVVVVPGAIADAVTQTVERRQGHQHDVGDDLGGGWRRLRDAERSEHQSVGRRPGAKAERLAARIDCRQRQPRALRGKGLHQWYRIDFATDWRVTRDDDAAGNFEWKAAL